MEGQGSNSISSRSSTSKYFAVSPIKVDSSLLRYLQCRSPAPARSPLAAIENFHTPPARSPTAMFKVEEDVVVMDGILVGAVPGGKSRSSSSSSLGCSSAGSNCWQSPRLKVSHGKEELCPSRFPNKKRFGEKAIAKVCTFNSPGPCAHGAKCSFVHHLASESESPPYVTAVTTPKVSKISPMKLESSSKSYNNIDSFTLTSSDWSPFDDGIDITLPPSASAEKSPSREAVNAYINGVLYGDSRGKRLPVFAEFCPE